MTEIEIQQHKAEVELAFGMSYQKHCEQGFKDYLKNCNPNYITPQGINTIFDSFLEYDVDLSNVRIMATEYFAEQLKKNN